MAGNAFTAGVKPGGLTTSTEIRILLCYLIQHAGTPLSQGELETALLGEELVNYFELASNLSDLLEQGFVREENGRYTILPAGADIAEALADDVPRSVRDAAVRATLAAQQFARKEAQHHAQITPAASGTGYNVQCSIRDMESVEFYLSRGVNRVILGSAALSDPAFVREAVKRWGKKIAVGIDARDGKVAAEGWTAQSETDYMEMARRMEDIGVRYLIVTDIAKDGTMAGPNLVMLDKINRAVSCSVIASGGVSSLKDIVDLNNLGLYGAIAGKALYTKALDLRAAVSACQRLSGNTLKVREEIEDHLERYFLKSDLIPAVVQ